MRLYLKSAFAYRCLADESVSAAGPRVRSYAMNSFLGEPGPRGTVPGWRQFVKMSDVTEPKPSDMVVFLDEHANSIDDGAFLVDPSHTNRWADLPASRHGGMAAMSFADGHSELHKWRDARTKQPMVPKGPKVHTGHWCRRRPGRGVGD